MSRRRRARLPAGQSLPRPRPRRSVRASWRSWVVGGATLWARRYLSGETAPGSPVTQKIVADLLADSCDVCRRETTSGRKLVVSRRRCRSAWPISFATNTQDQPASRRKVSANHVLPDRYRPGRRLPAVRAGGRLDRSRDQELEAAHGPGAGRCGPPGLRPCPAGCGARGSLTAVRLNTPGTRSVPGVFTFGSAQLLDRSQNISLLLISVLSKS